MDIEKAKDICKEIIRTNMFNRHTDAYAIETVLNELEKKDKEIEHQIEKRNNQKEELAILNEKQKEFNKLTNTLKSYKGQFKRQQNELEKKDKVINEMSTYIIRNISREKIEKLTGLEDKEGLANRIKEVMEEIRREEESNKQTQ